MFQTQDLHVKEIVRLLTPRELKAQSPTTDAANAHVARSRERVIRILRREDPRLLVVIGPCSIHDEKSALDYAARLNGLREKFAGSMEIVMRVYFEKPRTIVGWKGLINDPHLDNSQDIETGLKIARRLLLQITRMGLPAATEFLDPIVPQYIADLITWAAIGARTTESQTHREMASGLSMPVGLKNSTDGSLQVAIDAMGAARHPHSFLGIDQDGVTSIVRTAGNPDAHIVLRGGRAQTNFDAESIRAAEEKLKLENLPRSPDYKEHRPHGGQSGRAHRVARRPRADEFRRGKHPRGGGKIEIGKPAAGADGGLQPREFRKAACAAGGRVAERDSAARGRHPVAHRPDGREQHSRRQPADSKNTGGIAPNG